MRGRSAIAILLAILLSVPVVGGMNNATTTAMEDDEEMDPVSYTHLTLPTILRV